MSGPEIKCLVSPGRQTKPEGGLDGSPHGGQGRVLGWALPSDPATGCDGLASFEQERAVSCFGICLSFPWLLL